MEDVLVKIYVLCDPITCKIRYIGRTKKDLETRLYEHVWKSIKENRTHKHQWINNLKKLGRIPIIKKIYEIKGWKESHKFEQLLINKYKDKKNLTNLDDRGEGGLNRIISEKEKEKISNSLKNYYKDNYNPKAKAIEVFDLEGNYIKSYLSATDFAIKLGVSTRQVTRVASQTYGRRTIKGFQIKYKDDVKTVISKFKIKKKEKYISLKKRRIITILDIITNEIQTFSGIEELCNCINCNRSWFHTCEKRNILLLKKYKIITGSV